MKQPWVHMSLSRSPLPPPSPPAPSSTTVWKHQFFSTQHSLWSNSHIHTWLLEDFPHLGHWFPFSLTLKVVIPRFMVFSGLSLTSGPSGVYPTSSALLSSCFSLFSSFLPYLPTPNFTTHWESTNLLSYSAVLSNRVNILRFCWIEQYSFFFKSLYFQLTNYTKLLSSYQACHAVSGLCTQ